MRFMVYIGGNILAIGCVFYIIEKNSRKGVRYEDIDC